MSLGNQSIMHRTFDSFRESAVKVVAYSLSNLLKAFHSIAQRVFDGLFCTSKRLFIVSDLASKEHPRKNIQDRLDFFFPDLSSDSITVTSSMPWQAVLSLRPVLFFHKMARLESVLKKIVPNLFYVDYRHHALDGWEWVRASHYHRRHRPDIRRSKSRFVQRIEELQALGLKRSYIFGTGPSLEKAFGRDWSDGYRIVSNTIVRRPGSLESYRSTLHRRRGCHLSLRPHCLCQKVPKRFGLAPGRNANVFCLSCFFRRNRST